MVQEHSYFSVHQWLAPSGRLLAQIMFSSLFLLGALQLVLVPPMCLPFETMSTFPIYLLNWKMVSENCAFYFPCLVSMLTRWCFIQMFLSHLRWYSTFISLISRESSQLFPPKSIYISRVCPTPSVLGELWPSIHLGISRNLCLFVFYGVARRACHDPPCILLTGSWSGSLSDLWSHLGLQTLKDSYLTQPDQWHHHQLPSKAFH